MVSLTEQERLLLDNLLQHSFGSLNEYIPYATEMEIVRLLHNISPVFILKPWDTYLNLSDLGHSSSEDLVFFDTLFREIKRFSLNDGIFGSEVDHITWLNSLKHGQQFYLRIANLTSVKCFLGIACTKLPLRQKQAIIKDWITELSWNVNSNLSSEVFLTINNPTNQLKSFKLYYLKYPYTYTLTKEEVQRDPSTEIIELVVEQTISLYRFKEGYYLFEEVTELGTSVWYKLDNITGTNADSYTYRNELNFFGQKSTIQISLNIANSTATPSSLARNKSFLVFADLVPIS